MASIRTEERLPYALYRGWAFYVHMVLIGAEVALTLAAAYDFILSRRLGGDPTFYSRDPSGSNALTYSNPSFAGEDPAHIKHSTNGHSNGAGTRSSNPQPHKIPSGRTSPHRSTRSGTFHRAPIHCKAPIIQCKFKISRKRRVVGKKKTQNREGLDGIISK